MAEGPVVSFELQLVIEMVEDFIWILSTINALFPIFNHFQLKRLWANYKFTNFHS